MRCDAECHEDVACLREYNKVFLIIMVVLMLLSEVLLI
jgi:hypothetical protein